MCVIWPQSVCLCLSKNPRAADLEKNDNYPYVTSVIVLPYVNKSKNSKPTLQNCEIILLGDEENVLA